MKLTCSKCKGFTPRTVCVVVVVDFYFLLLSNGESLSFLNFLFPLLSRSNHSTITNYRPPFYYATIIIIIFIINTISVFIF